MAHSTIRAPIGDIGPDFRREKKVLDSGQLSTSMPRRFVGFPMKRRLPDYGLDAPNCTFPITTTVRGRRGDGPEAANTVGRVRAPDRYRRHGAHARWRRPITGAGRSARRSRAGL